jgi:hypothetical protein
MHFLGIVDPKSSKHSSKIILPRSLAIVDKLKLKYLKKSETETNLFFDSSNAGSQIMLRAKNDSVKVLKETIKGI